MTGWEENDMPTWTEDELTTIGGAEELKIASLRADGALRPYVTIWVVRDGDDLYVRSAHGTDNPWFVRAQVRHAGRIGAGGIERDVTFEDAPANVHAALDLAYHAKHDRFGSRVVNPVVGSIASTATLRLVPSAGHQP
jgi:hypothetical protein